MGTLTRTSTPAAAHSYSLHERIGECNLQEWEEIIRGTESNILMSAPFISSVEEAFADQSRFAHAIVHDAGGAAVACASFCSFSIDVNLLADGIARRVTGALGKLAPSLIKKKVIFCGLPVSVGAKHLAIVPGARHEEVLRTMHDIAVSLAKRERASFIVFKEFEDADCDKLDRLLHLGYRRFSSPAMHRFSRRFADFSDYCGALRSRYRQCVRKSVNKGKSAGLRYERLTDTHAILRVYDESLHRLYEAVALSSTNRLELLPLTFFHSLARHLPGRVGLTVVYAGRRVVAFNWNLFEEGTYHFLFAGLDYDLNADFDLYFNVMYAEMDFAFRLGAESLIFGQTADDFKIRLGCTQQRLSFYVAPVGLSAALIHRFAGKILFPEPPPAPVHHVFPDSNSRLAPIPKTIRQ